MKLWELLFRHYAPKDSEEGIICYLLADTSEQIYDFLKTEPTIPDGTQYGRGIYTSWEYVDDPEDEEYDENHRKRLIECCGEMFDEEEEVSNAFYGVIHYGWNCICEDIKNIEIAVLKSVGITVIDVSKKDK